MRKVICLYCIIVFCSGCFCSETNGGTEPQINVTLNMAHKGTGEIDLNLLDSYGRPAESVRQFFVAARDIFEKDRFARFADNNDLAAAAEKFGAKVFGGPMLGDVSTNGVSVWLRTVKPAEISVEVTDNKGNVTTFGPVCSRQDKELAVVVRLDGLTPDSEYTYRVFVDGQELKLNYPTRFTTLAETKGSCRIAFGSCFHKSGIHNPYLLGQVKKRGNKAMLLLGDIAVDDRNNKVGLHRSDYLLRDLSPAWQEFSASMPLYATWDDHDYFDNDKSGIPKGYKSKDVLAVREVWTENWNNPAYGQDGEGIYFHTRIGPADVIMLDTRSLRKKEPNTENAYLGDQQTEWLKQELLKCKGPFTIISSGTMWSDNISNGKDSWGTWDSAGRESLFEFIEKNRVPGVLLISGDRHGARGMKIPRASGYTFYEFEPASLGGMDGPKAWSEDRKNQIFGYGRTHLKAFGEFTFDTAQTDPTVTFRLIDETGKTLEEIILHQSQLTPGKK